MRVVLAALVLMGCASAAPVSDAGASADAEAPDDTLATDCTRCAPACGRENICGDDPACTLCVARCVVGGERDMMWGIGCRAGEAPRCTHPDGGTVSCFSR
jgi:hypothetical protein